MSILHIARSFGSNFVGQAVSVLFLKPMQYTCSKSSVFVDLLCLSCLHVQLFFLQ